MERRSNGSLPVGPEVVEIVVADARAVGAEPAIEAVIGIVLDAVESRHTKRAYERALRDFAGWMAEQGRPLNRALVRRYVAMLREEEMGVSSINQRLSAIRTLVRELADNDALGPVEAQGILSIPGVRQRGQRLGNWLSQAQAQRLLGAPDTTTVKGLRDRAMLGVLLGCGLRREELVTLTLEHIQSRAGRWVIVDLIGKRNKARSVPMPGWAKVMLNAWLQVAGSPTSGEAQYLFRPVNKGSNVMSRSLTPQAIRQVVRRYAREAGLGEIAPHDLRRTFAKLAYSGGAPVDQISLSLGHDSIETTQRYLGIEQDLEDAPADRLGLGLE